MRINEIFSQAIDSIKANKLRSSLTLLAISVGVFAIISANTAVLVLDTYFRDTLSLMGGDVVTVSRTPSIQMGDDWRRYRNRPDITIRQMQELETRTFFTDQVGPSTTFRTTRVTFRDQETEPNVAIRGGNQYYLDNNAFDLKEGRNFQIEDIEHSRAVAILGYEVAESLFGDLNPIDRTIRVDGRPYSVIGVAEEKGNIFGQTLDRFVVIPYTHLMNVYGRDRNIAIQAKAPSIEFIEDTIDELTGLLRAIRQVAPGEQSNFEIETNETLGDVFNQFTAILYIIGFVVGGIALLGAGIGVMNIMLVSVNERTHEIGIRKSVGATKKAIISQFLMEAVAICQIGGVIGILFGILIGNAAALYLDANVVFPAGAAVAGVIGITFIGLIFGVYPAYKAARLDPIESLRYE